MSISMLGCADCCGIPSCFLIIRRVGGFAEYVITHPTTNPITYFTGRRYKQAQFKRDFEPDYSLSCDGAGEWNHVPCAPTTVLDGYTCAHSFIFTLTSSFTELTNLPSVVNVGMYCDSDLGAIFGGSIGFNSDGYYGWYDPTLHDSHSCSDLGEASWFLYPVDESPIDGTGCGCVPPFLSGDCHNACPAWSRSASFSYDGTAYVRTVNLTSTSFANNGTCDCAQKTDYLEGPCYDPPLIPFDGQCDPPPGNIVAHPSWFVQSSPFSDSSTGTLSSEVSYAAVAASLIAGIATIQTTYSPADTHGVWYFYDYPTYTGDWTLDPAPFTGNLTNDSSAPYAIQFGVGYGNDFCTPPGPNFVILSPFVQHHYFSATWVLLGTSDAPGVDYFDTHICGIPMYNPNVTTPYVLVTYIVMNDYSLVFESCEDGVATGGVWIPQPDPLTFSSGYYAVDGMGNLTGPIGRITIMIEGTTCDTWDGVQPT